MVDIIIPTYKARETLPDALNSLVAQTKKMFIVTVVQDADGEDYSDIIEEYKRRGLKIRLIKMEKNGGPGMARQRGMDADPMSTYFMFMDADDMMLPSAVEMLSREALINDADIVSSSFIITNKGIPDIICDPLKMPCTWMHGKIYKAKYLRDNNIRFHPEIRLNEDSYFNLVAVNNANKKMVIQYPTYLWRQNDNSLTHQGGELGFFVKSWPQYILSQVCGLTDLGEKKGELSPPLVAQTLINIYKEHAKALSNSLHPKCNSSDYEASARKLKTLGENPLIKEAIKTVEFWNTIEEKLPACEKFGDNIIFYNIRFVDWLKEYIVEEL